VLALIHVDALNVELLDRLIADGRMPTFAELRRRAERLPLGTPATHFPAAAYYSMHSGLPVGDHGFYFPFQWSAPEQRLRYRLEFGPPPVMWERLTAAGRRSFVVDPYEFGPPARLVGLGVSGWQMANILSLLRWSVPKGWSRPYERRFGRSSDTQEVFGKRSARTLTSLRRAYLAASARIADLTTDVLRRERFDYMYVGLLAPHHAGHVFWDVSQLDVDDETRTQFEGTLPLMYEEADRAVGRILDALPDGADVIVVSPLGMGADTSRVDLLGEMLRLVLGGRPQEEAREAGGRIWRLRAAVPTSVRAAVARAMGARAARELTARLSTSGIDWSTTKAFLLPSDEKGQIRLNLRGRERDGIVDPAEADALMTEIAEGLMTFEDLGGGAAVTGVDRTADLFPGRRSDLLPDLIVRWSDSPSARIAGVRSERFGETRRRGGAGTGRNGSHTENAWALVLPGASSARTPSRPASVTDLAATVGAVLGIDDAPPGEPLLEPGP
jgi:predicted AlkP superfamily phosphohydrolase/phosphomutase